MAAARGADPVRQDRVTVFAAWRDELGFDQQHTPADLVELADRRYDHDQSFVRPAFHAALLTVAAQRANTSQIDSIRLGIWLKKHENTIADGGKLVADRSDARRPRWKLTRP
jgi:hypothetical protein